MKNRTNQFISQLKKITSHQLFFPAFLLVILLVTFGILTPWIGFYGDDWALIWNSYRMQNQDWIAFRPLVVFIYEVLSTILGPSFPQWLFVSILFRWAGALALFVFLSELFPARKEEARWFTLLFALYPGFVLYAPLTNIAPFAQPFFLFMSFYFMLVWLRGGSKWGYFLALSILFAVINLLITEYFFFFEFFRPLIILYARKKERSKRKLWGTGKLWLPYVFVMLAATIWRIYKINVNSPYKSNFSRMLSQPVQFLITLWQKMLHDFQQVIVKPIVSVFTYPASMGPRTLLLFVAVVVFTAVFVFIYFMLREDRTTNQTDAPKMKFFIFIPLGLLAFFFAGMPFWIADLEVAFVYSGLNRMAIPQAASLTLLLFGLIMLVQNKNRTMAIILVSVLAGLFAGNQFKAADNFRAKWVQHEKFFYNFSWRVPELEPGTVIILNPSGIGDNALAAALNWHYVEQERTDHLDYYFYQDDDHLLNDISNFEPGQDISNYHISGTFIGNTSNILVLHVEEGACLRVVDPDTDIYNPDITDFSREYIRYSNTNVILAESYLDLGHLDMSIHDNQNQSNWCFYYEKADLARQLADWQAVVEMGEKAFALSEHAGNAAELLPFIEGYAHISDWETALNLTNQVIDVSAEYSQMVCALWERIDKSTSSSLEKQESLRLLTLKLNCNFITQ